MKENVKGYIMTEDERKIVDTLIETKLQDRDLVKDLFKWLLIAFCIVSICFTVAIFTIATTYTDALKCMSNDYFYSDYDYGTVNQSVTQKVDQEVK